MGKGRERGKKRRRRRRGRGRGKGREERRKKEFRVKRVPPPKEKGTRQTHTPHPQHLAGSKLFFFGTCCGDGGPGRALLHGRGERETCYSIQSVPPSNKEFSAV